MANLYKFDLNNLTKQERDLLLLEAEVFNDNINEYRRNYYAKNRDYLLQKKREYVEKNREQLNQYYKDYRINHPEIYKDKIECKICQKMFAPCRVNQHNSTKHHIMKLKTIKIKEEARRLE